MARPRVNLYLDLLAFLALFATVITGLVLRLALPPGSGRIEVGSPERPVATLWGWARHEWGGVHYVVSLALHIWQHRGLAPYKNGHLRALLPKEASF